MFAFHFKKQGFKWNTEELHFFAFYSFTLIKCLYLFIYSCMFSKHVILVRVMVNPEPYEYEPGIYPMKTEQRAAELDR